MMDRRVRFGTGIVALLVLAGCGGSSPSSSSAGYGKPGDASKADRTVAVQIATPLAYSPATLSVKPGETVVFKVSNNTTGIHEFVLGNAKVQDDYQKSMASMSSAPMLMGDTANTIDMEPGQTKQLVWTFPAASTTPVIYGSHEPGDYAHGLKGLITVG